MSRVIKNKQAILNKLGIEKLNTMQEEVALCITSVSDLMVLSPTGTGKTLAFLLPIMEGLYPNLREVQAVVLAPSRELAIQIAQVARSMGTGYKINVVYGGRPFAKDKEELQHPPALIVGTPGRIADHLRRGTLDTAQIQTIVFDEFDKALEVGFESEMKEIVKGLPALKKRILTSATKGISVPKFVGLETYQILNYLGKERSQLAMKSVFSPSKDKLETLVDLLCTIGNEPGIIFCNYKDTIQRVSDFLAIKGVSHGCFYGGMEQRERERALIKFRNHTHQLLIATDLAARGIDIPELKFIIHYQLPLRLEEFTHRNGRTARMNAKGTSYILQWEEEELPAFVSKTKGTLLKKRPIPSPSAWTTLFVSGGRKDKISKSDIAGLFFKKGGLVRDELGVIELKNDCVFVAVPISKAKQLMATLNNTRLKKKKVRVTAI